MHYPAHYDSFDAWLAHAPDDEIAEAIYRTLSEEELEEFMEEVDRRVAEQAEQ